METKEKTEKKEQVDSPVLWTNIKPAELEKIIIQLYEEGNPPAKIGLILRDKYGIPKAKLLGKKITQVLKSSKKEWVSEKEIIQKKIENLEKHIKQHKHDYTAKRSHNKKLWALAKIKKQKNH